jgi:hypothetical protein
MWLKEMKHSSKNALMMTFPCASTCGAQGTSWQLEKNCEVKEGHQDLTS